MNQYKSIARYYDLLMGAGYYDHESLARVVQATIGERRRVLELGVGTGLLARELLELDSSYHFTGVDFSPSMLEIAKERLPSRASLIECDVAEMNLGRTFDVALSSGGTWVIIQSDKELLLGTHLLNREKDFKGLQNVADHLDAGGLLLLSVQKPHEDRDIDLVDGIVYSQRVVGRNGTSDHYFIEKGYSFKRNGQLLAEDTLTLGFYKQTVFPEMLADAGFSPLGMTDTNKFFVWRKTK